MFIFSFITSYVIGPVPGGIMISHGTLFMILLWISVYWLKKLAVKSVTKSLSRG